MARQVGSDGRAHRAHGAINFHRGPAACVLQQGLDVAQYESGIHGGSSVRQGLLVIPYLGPAGQKPLGLDL
jgi:hypothetical protein